MVAFFFLAQVLFCFKEKKGTSDPGMAVAKAVGQWLEESFQLSHINFFFYFFSTGSWCCF